MNKQTIFSLLLITNITTYGMIKKTHPSSKETKQQAISLSNRAQEKYFSSITEKNKTSADHQSGLEALNDIIEYSRFTKIQGPYSELPQSSLFKLRATIYQHKLSRL